MPAALQLNNFYKQGLAGGAFEALSANPASAATFYTIPGAGDAPVGWLAEIWAADDDSPCEFSFTASRFHDQTFGIRTAVPAGSTLSPPGAPVNVSPCGYDQPIYSADVLSVKANGTAGDNVNVTCITYYPNLPGVDFNGVTADYVRQNTKYLVGVNVQPTSDSGAFGASVTLNSETALLHAGRQYAVLGFTAQGPIQAVAIQGIDVGNLLVGGPVTGDPNVDANLFPRLAMAYNAPLIPVIQANNQGAIDVQAANLVGGVEVIDVLLAELTTTPITV